MRRLPPQRRDPFSGERCGAGVPPAPFTSSARRRGRVPAYALSPSRRLGLAFILSFATWFSVHAQTAPRLALTLIPPGPVTDQIHVEARAGLTLPHATSTARGPFETPPGEATAPAVLRPASAAPWTLRWYLGAERPHNLLDEQVVHLTPGESVTASFRWPTHHRAGRHRIRVVAQHGRDTWRTSRTLEIRPSPHRSTGRLAGAWAGLYHWSEQEGRLWNAALRQMTDRQWRELVRAMARIDLNILVLGESFRNQQYVGQHAIEQEGYQGKAFYPSALYPGRMDIASPDPFATILDEADRRGLHVFMPVGLYAWFDFTPGSLAWHQQVATELWQRYGQHPSFYGWYVTEEIAGNLGETPARRREIVDFFRAFQAHVRRLAPEKPVLLASNCHLIPAAGDTYRELLPHCDILCPFGFHRMPDGDLTGEEAARRLQQYCDEAGAHLWMDLEVFLFDATGALYPRPIQGLIDDLQRFPNFEAILCYQVPGLLTAPSMSRQLGGPAAVRLYRDYQRFLSQGVSPTD